LRDINLMKNNTPFNVGLFKSIVKSGRASAILRERLVLGVTLAVAYTAVLAAVAKSMAGDSQLPR
jgi:hypothetical protein